jgi:hypothetical protein
MSTYRERAKQLLDKYISQPYLTTEKEEECINAMAQLAEEIEGNQNKSEIYLKGYEQCKKDARQSLNNLYAIEQVEELTVDILVCEECGSSDIQTLMWVNPNTNEVGGELSSEDEEHNWCKVCEKHTSLTSLEQYNLNKIELWSIRVKE